MRCIMRRQIKHIIEFIKREDGPTAVECALMFGLVVVICLVAIQSVQPYAVESDRPVVVEVSSNPR
jgi:Flp pilus assembly pilin Flp